MSQPLILAPERLHARHDVSRARTYVVCPREEPQRVVGYYALSTAMEQRIALPNAKLRRLCLIRYRCYSSVGWPSIANIG